MREAPRGKVEASAGGVLRFLRALPAEGSLDEPQSFLYGQKAEDILLGEEESHRGMVHLI